MQAELSLSSLPVLVPFTVRLSLLRRIVSFLPFPAAPCTYRTVLAWWLPEDHACVCGHSFSQRLRYFSSVVQPFVQQSYKRLWSDEAVIPDLRRGGRQGWKELSLEQRLQLCSLLGLTVGNRSGWGGRQVGVQRVLPSSPGMYPVRHHVCERQESAAYGPEPLLWGRELLHHTAGGGEAAGPGPIPH